MIYILDKSEKIVGVLNNNVNVSNKNIYFNDLHTEDLKTGAETFSFSTITNKEISNSLVVGNYIAFDKNNSLRLFQIIETEEEKTENIVEKNIYCETVGLELSSSIYNGGNMNDVNIERFLTNILQNTNWKVGNIDSSLTTTLSLDIEENEIYSLIQEYIHLFNAEIQFRVEINNNIITGKYIDVFSQRGNILNKRLEVNKNIESISRKINIYNYATKLIGRGNDNLDFKDVIIDSIDKPIGQDFIINKNAFETLNNKGNHITKIYEYDTNDPYELLRQTKKALDEMSKPQITYEIDSNILNFDNIEIGDTITISDMSFNPPLTISARVGYLETSKSDKNNNKATLTNFKEIKSKISNFKVSGKQIIEAINNNTSEVIDGIKIGIDGTDITNKINQIETKQDKDISELNNNKGNWNNAYNRVLEWACGKINNSTNINGKFLEGKSITGDKICGGVIEGTQLKTSEPYSNGGMWIRDNGMQLGQTSIMYDASNRFAISSKDNIVISNGTGRNIFLMPSEYVSISGNCTANSFRVGTGTDAFFSHGTWYSQWAGKNLETYGIKMNFLNLIGTSSGNLHVTNGNGSPGGIYANFMNSYSVNSEYELTNNSYSALEKISRATVSKNKIIPKMTTFSDNELDDYIKLNQDEMIEMNITNIVPLLWKAIQELKEEINLLKGVDIIE